ncbi:hypothetical protein CesoFtcFv8_009152 [Champsocephalus esox]|uniref:Uncharacterized protein n=1 Tax=Champsocephalus esox TaxID=159716 RepID=A0AAN8C8V8_9TELE|nr:hypothetical protein CesoFtcFv8_009152 [Champsocephalus esox]
MGEEVGTLSSPESLSQTKNKTANLAGRGCGDTAITSNKLTQTCLSRLCTAHSRPQLLEDALTTRSSSREAARAKP